MKALSQSWAPPAGPTCHHSRQAPALSPHKQARSPCQASSSWKSTCIAGNAFHGSTSCSAQSSRKPRRTSQKGYRVLNVSATADQAVQAPETVKRKEFDSTPEEQRKKLQVQQARVNKEITLHKEEYFVNKQGKHIYTQQWLPRGEARAVVFILHGLNENSGRYYRLAAELNKRNIAVCGLDWVGHGRSDGLHALVEDLDHVGDDTLAYLKEVRSSMPDLPCFAFGHSTGGAILLKALHDAGGAQVNGVIFSAAAFQIIEPNPILKAFAPLLSALLPTLPVPGADRPPTVCRDLVHLAEKYNDPLNYTGRVRARTGYEILKLTAETRSRFSGFNIPFLVCHGTDDMITLASASKELYEKAPVKDKAIRIYDGLVHDLLFEPEREMVLADMLGWLEERLA